MTSIDIRRDDIEAAARALDALQQRHGAPRAMEISAARIRAEADFLARWTGPTVAAQLLAAEAHRLVAEAAADIAVPPPADNARRRPAAARAAGWAVGMLGVALLGVSGWALG